MNLIIDGIEITFLSSTDLTQNYAPVIQGELLRMADGTGIKQTPTWGKLVTTITGSGWLPEGLSAVDYSTPIIVDCIGRRSITSSSNVITIPGTVRPDKDPWAMAYVNGAWLNVTSSFVGDTLTITPTAGATLYQALWMPRLTLLLNEPETETDHNGASYTWTIYGEEE